MELGIRTPGGGGGRKKEIEKNKTCMTAKYNQHQLFYKCLLVTA